MRMSKLNLTGAALALLMTTATGAYAQTKSVGTIAGTDIVNTVNVSFSRGGSIVSTSASATFYVDRKIDMLMETVHTSAILLDLGAGTFSQQIDYSFTNYSNASADFTISVTVPAGFTEAATGDDTYQVFVDGALIANGAFITVAAGADPDIQVIARFDPSTNDETRSFTVTAAPTDDFAEVTGGNITAAGAQNRNTIHLFAAADQGVTASVDLTSPLLTASKTVAVISEDAGFDCEAGTAASGSQAAIPGACIEYTITVNNTGGAAMRNLEISDVAPVGVTFVGATGSDFDIVVGSNTITAEAGSNLTSNNSFVLRIRATID